jgi:hypothetical protein
VYESTPGRARDTKPIDSGAPPALAGADMPAFKIPQAE